jgi:hypothetical protein
MWSEVGERALVGPTLIKEAEERVAEIREKLKAAQSRQKSYSDKKRREVSFNRGDFVYLKVSPIRGTRRFQVHGKLAPRYIGLYRVQKKIGAVAYRLELPERMADIHLVFHVSQLKRCLRVPEKERVPKEEIALQTHLRYQEVPVKILDTIRKRTRNSEVRICRVQWSKHGVEEATWEREDALKKEFPHLFRSQPNLEDEIHFKWGRFVTLAFLSYLNCITNHSFKKLLNLFRCLISRSPPPDFPPFRHRAVSSSFSAEPPVPFPFPLAPLSCHVTIVSRSAACTCLAAIVGAARVSPLFFSHILFKSILFLSSKFSPDSFFFAPASSFFFSPVLPTACSSCSPLLAPTRGPAHDPSLPPLLAMHAHHAALVTPRPLRPLLLAVPLRACCPCMPSRRAARCCAGPSLSRPLALVACALFPSIPAAINGEAPVLPVTLPCRPSPSSSRPINQTPSRPSLCPHRPSTSPPLPHATARRHCSPLPATTHLRGQPFVDRLRTR